jgi:hypothetical protein
VDDFMTADNLVNQGRPFVDRFTQAILTRISSAGAVSSNALAGR